VLLNGLSIEDIGTQFTPSSKETLYVIYSFISALIKPEKEDSAEIVKYSISDGTSYLLDTT